MQEVKIKKKLDRTIITHKIGKNEQINTGELDILKKKEIPELLPVELVKNMFGAQLQFEVVNCIDLKHYLKQKISFIDFLDLVVSIVHVVSECDKHAIPNSNLELSSDLIFYNMQSREVRMVYWPLIALSEYVNIEHFFRQMGEHYPCEEGSKDSQGKEEYLQLFSARAAFHLLRFKKSVEAIRRRYYEEDINKDEESYGIDPLEDYEEIYLGDSNAGENRGNTDTDSENHGELNGNEHEITNPNTGYDSKDVTRSVWGGGLERPIGDPGATVVMGKTAALYRKSTNTRIELDRFPFAVGRDPQMHGYVVTGNPCVGRKHAIFSERNGIYYIKDNNSTNGVRINGKKVPSGAEEKISGGYEIELGNEKFLFYSPDMY